jgi:hypothetical protein
MDVVASQGPVRTGVAAVLSQSNLSWNSRYCRNDHSHEPPATNIPTRTRHCLHGDSVALVDWIHWFVSTDATWGDQPDRGMEPSCELHAWIGIKSQNRRLDLARRFTSDFGSYSEASNS